MSTEYDDNPTPPTTVPNPAPLAPGEFYSGAGMLKPTLDVNLTRLGDQLGMSVAEQAAERKAFADVIRTSGLDPIAVGRPLHDAWTRARLASDEQAPDLDALAAEVRQHLRENYGGAERAEELLGRAQKFVASHPRLAAILETGGVGSQVETVSRIVDHVIDTNFR